MILVTGATGQVGRSVVRQLVDAGHEVRALTRQPDRAIRPDGTVPDGVEVVGGDLTDQESLSAALRGADSVFVFPAPAPGAAATVGRALAGSSVGRAVVLSSGAVGDSDPAADDWLVDHHASFEAAASSSGLEWTALRPHAFATNTLGWVDQIRRGDVVRLPFPESTGAPIHEADIAAVAVLALTGNGHSGQAYALTGPESLTASDQVQAIGLALGRPLRVEPVDPEVARSTMDQRIPRPVLDRLFRLWADSVGQPATVTNTVQELLGRPARRFVEWAADHRDDFAASSRRQ